MVRVPPKNDQFHKCLLLGNLCGKNDFFSNKVFLWRASNQQFPQFLNKEQTKNNTWHKKVEQSEFRSSFFIPLMLVVQ